MSSVLLVLAIHASPKVGLSPRKFKPLPVGSITPKGWLLTQLKLQAEGLSGHLAQFWNDVMSSVWIGGSGDGGLHERTPYWLNGIIPLAFLLSNAGINQLPPVIGVYQAPWGRDGGWLSGPVCTSGVDLYGEDLSGPSGYAASSAEACRNECARRSDCYGFVVDNCSSSQVTCWLKSGQGPTHIDPCRCFGIVPRPTAVDVMAQAREYVSYILAHQHTDGWLGPNDDASSAATFNGGDYWGPSNVLQALWQWAEASQVAKNETAFSTASEAVLRHLLEQHRRMRTFPLKSWASARWIDMALSAEWVLDHARLSSEQQAALLDLIRMLHAQGEDWDGWFEAIPGTPNHNVNVAQGLKSAAV